MSQVQQSAGLRRAVSASTAATTKTARSTPRQRGDKVLPFPSLPFVTEWDHGRPRRNYFDVPAEGFWPGRITGAKCFQSLMSFVREQGALQSRAVVQRVIEAAVLQLQQNTGARFAAWNFLGLTAGAVVGAAASLNCAGFAADAVLRAERDLQDDLDAAARRRAEFPVRMRAARAAKQQLAAATAAAAAEGAL